MPKLVITEGEDSREVEIKDGDTLGRTAQNAVVLKVPEASRSHCRFSSERGSWFVEDLGSSNGTLVNGRRVTKFELQDGDEIRIGAVSLRFFDAGPEEEASVGTEAAWGGDDLSLEEEVFLVLGGAGREGEVVRLPDGTVGIGRNAKNAIVLKDASVSGDHARISRDGSRCVLTDLGSSNGSFVNGRKVAEADLASGDRLRFGNVAAVFGVGDPKDFAVATGEDAEAGTFTRAMEAQGLEDDASFEFKTTLPRGERIWNLVMLAVLLVLGAGAAWLLTRPAAGRREGPRPLERGQNLLPEDVWSFEVPGDAPGGAAAWVRLDAQAGAFAGEVPEPVRSGRSAYQFVRDDAGAPPTWAGLDQPIPLSPETSYRLAAARTGDGAVALLGLRWLGPAAEGGERGELGRTVASFGTSGFGEFQEDGEVFVAPAGAESAQVLVGAAGQGTVVLDDVRMVAADLPAGMVAELPPFRLILDPMGTVRMQRFGRTVIDGIGIARLDPSLAPALQGEGWLGAPSAGPAERVGRPWPGAGDLRVRIEAAEGRLRQTLSGPGLGHATHLVVPLVPRAGSDLEISVQDGESARRFTGAFAGQSGHAFIVGSGDDRARIEFRDEARGLLRLEGRFVETPRPRLEIALSGLAHLGLEFQLSFEAEEAAAAESLRAAAQAARDQRPGEALAILEQVRSRVPFSARIMQEAGRLEADLLERGRARLAALEAAADDAIFFRTLGRDPAVVEQLRAERARYAGSALEAAFAALAERIEGAQAEWENPRREAAASRLLARAHAYWQARQDAMARVFAEAILHAHRGTRAEADAQAILDGSAPRGAEGGER